MPLGDEATAMRLRVCEWLADQLLRSLATLTDLIQSVPTFRFSGNLAQVSQATCEGQSFKSIV